MSAVQLTLPATTARSFIHTGAFPEAQPSDCSPALRAHGLLLPRRACCRRQHSLLLVLAGNQRLSITVIDRAPGNFNLCWEKIFAALLVSHYNQASHLPAAVPRCRCPTRLKSAPAAISTRKSRPEARSGLLRFGFGFSLCPLAVSPFTVPGTNCYRSDFSPAFQHPKTCKASHTPWPKRSRNSPLPCLGGRWTPRPSDLGRCGLPVPWYRAYHGHCSS